jgi:nucleoside-diphosphate-sugar epimerase
MLAEKIKQLMSSDVNIATDDQRLRPENSEVFRLWGDNSLITSLTEFKPEYTIDEGLRKTIDWFIQSGNLKKYKSEIYNV